MSINYPKSLVRSILAGICIGIGGCVYLGSEVKWVGAILFAIGLLTVLFYKLDLYTGKVGYFVENPTPSYIIYLLLVIVGNFIGALMVGLMMPSAGAEVLVQNKLANFEFLPVLFKGLLCGVLMFIAVDSFRAGKGPIATFFCVPVFILSGFEHSIADMFYFCSAGVFTLEALVFILVVILGNAIGCLLIPTCRKYMYDGEDPMKV